MKTLSLKPQPLRFPAVIPPDAREAYLVLVDWNGFVSALRGGPQDGEDVRADACR